MAQCQLCKRESRQLKFATDHIKVCTRCVNSLNEFSEPAIHAQNRLGDMLARGVERNALRDLDAPEEWKRRRARWKLDNFAAAHAEALPGWLNDLLADERNSTRDYKTVRAHRRGLLRFDGDRSWSYPNNWETVAAGIRKRDGYKCKVCGERDAELHVHHIIYLSNFGTNQQGNLVTLCRACHEKEHDRVFDFGEQVDPEARNPLKPQPEHLAPPVKPIPAPAEAIPPSSTPAPSPPAPVPVPVPAPVLAPAPVPVPVPKHHPVAHTPAEQSHSESRVCPRCGGACIGESVVPWGSVVRCIKCGFLPLLQIYDDRFAKREPEEGPCEGAFVLEQVKSKASQPPAASGVNEPQSVHPEHRPVSLLTRYEPVPDTEKRLDAGILIPVAVLLGLVVIIVVAMGM